MSWPEQTGKVDLHDTDSGVQTEEPSPILNPASQQLDPSDIWAFILIQMQMEIWACLHQGGYVWNLVEE